MLLLLPFGLQRALQGFAADRQFADQRLLKDRRDVEQVAEACAAEHQGAAAIRAGYKPGLRAALVLPEIIGQPHDRAGAMFGDCFWR